MGEKTIDVSQLKLHIRASLGTEDLRREGFEATKFKSATPWIPRSSGPILPGTPGVTRHSAAAISLARVHPTLEDIGFAFFESKLILIRGPRDHRTSKTLIDMF